MLSPIAVDLPIVAVLPALAEMLSHRQRVVLEAPPGAGKSTYLPLWLLHRGADSRHRIVLIQPRRLAASAVAGYLARQLDSEVDGIVGLRTRFDRKVSADTVIEVVTEGVFLRQVQRDPELTGIGYVLFDEYHERSWQADLALGLTLEAQTQWRDSDNPLRLIVMSATLPAAAVANWIDAAIVRTEGRSFPVEISYSPVGRKDDIAHLVGEIRAAIQRGARRTLVFLPGWQMMQKVQRQLEAVGIEPLLLHSSVAPDQQQRALEFDPVAPAGVILATNIAETSLTIPGVDTVIDSGLVRRARFDPKCGMDRLETGWISRASAEQRAGRAGRLGPGQCVRLWSKEQHGRLLAHDPAEIEQVDLTPLMLELALWGGGEAGTVLPEPPTPARLDTARQLLRKLDALDAAARITPSGRAMAELGLHPRLAHLVLYSRERGCDAQGALLAALLSEGDFVRREGDTLSCDLDWRLRLLSGQEQTPAISRATFQRIKQLAHQLRSRGNDRPISTQELGTGALLLAAFPDRVAQQRQPGSSRYLCVDGFEVVLSEHDSLRGQSWLVVAEHDGERGGARVRLAAAVDAATVEQQLGSQIQQIDNVSWDEARGLLTAFRQRKLGAIVLSESTLPISDELAAKHWLQSLRERGIAWLQLPEATQQWLARACWLRTRRADWPDFSEPTLLAALDEWLLPYLPGVRKLADLRALDVGAALRARLDYSQQQAMNQLAPERFVLPSGVAHRIEYRDNAPPKLAARLTEFYGLDQHPQLFGEPLLLELLAPSQRPLQLTQDLPAFWRNAYREVRKEMKGRYPKHFWPDEPWNAPATATVKKRMPSFE